MVEIQFKLRSFLIQSLCSKVHLYSESIISPFVIIRHWSERLNTRGQVWYPCCINPDWQESPWPGSFPRDCGQRFELSPTQHGKHNNRKTKPFFSLHQVLSRSGCCPSLWILLLIELAVSGNSVGHVNIEIISPLSQCKWEKSLCRWVTLKPPVLCIIYTQLIIINKSFASLIWAKLVKYLGYLYKNVVSFSSINEQVLSLIDFKVNSILSHKYVSCFWFFP